MQIKARVMEVSGGVFNENPWVQVKLRSLEIADGAILKYKVDAKKVSEEALKAKLDKEVVVDVEVTRGNADLASLKVVGIS